MRPHDSDHTRGIRHLRYENIAPGLPYHAALVAADGPHARGFQATEHDHDFYELMFVLAGDAIHGFNGATAPLRAGALIFLQPRDRHFVRFQTGRRLHYINIAMHAELWTSFRDMTEIGTDLDMPGQVNPIAAALHDAVSEECAFAFRRALGRFQETQISVSALRVEGCRLLATVTPWLLSAVRGDAAEDDTFPDGTPPWLVRACRRLRRDSDALRLGLPAFVAEAGVSSAHLSRVLKATTNQTATEFINRLRLECAARLLTTTTLSVLDIAGECGFDQPSYFYRLFRARYSTSPHAYRIAAAHRVAPKSMPRGKTIPTLPR